MNITIKTSGDELSLDTKELIEKKFGALERLIHNPDIVTLFCEIDESIAVERAGAKYKAKGNLTIKGRQFHAEGTGDTLEGAVDKVRDELQREIKSTFGKERGLMKRGGAALKKMLRFGR